MSRILSAFALIALSTSSVSADDTTPEYRPVINIEPVSVWTPPDNHEPTPLENRIVGLAARSLGSRLSFKLALLGGGIGYTAHESEIRERYNHETERTEFEIREWEEELALEAMGGLDLFVGVRLTPSKSLVHVSLGYEGIATATHTSILHRHMLALRAATGFVDFSGGAGMFAWHGYGDMRAALGIACFLEIAVPFGNRGWFISMPFTMERYVGTNVTSASGSLAIGWSRF